MVKGIKFKKEKPNKARSSSMSRKRGTIKTRLIVFPLIVVLIVITGIGFFSSYNLKKSMLKEMEANGIFLAQRLSKNMQDNLKALEVINKSLDDKITSAANVALDQKKNLDNKLLKTMVKNLEVEEISYYNSKGELIYSNIDDLVGWKAEPGHPVHDFMTGSDKHLVEDIRQDSISNDYIKFGYLKDSSGNFVQVGINANQVQELTDNFSIQNTIEDIVQDEEIYYLLFIDKNAEIIAHNNKDEIGMVLDDEGSISAAVKGVPHVQEWHYEEDDVDVLDISYPITVDGEHMGAISIGFSLENVNKSINSNRLTVTAVTILAFVVLGSILYASSRYVAMIIDKLKEQVNYMEEGDFSRDITEDLINKNDELGEISGAIATMQKEMRGIIKNVINTSQNLAASSEELTATAEQSATSANEVSKAIEDIASGATEQARDTEVGATSIFELGDVVIKNDEYIKDLNESAEMVNSLKDEGLDILEDLVEKTNNSSKSSREVQQVIVDTNESAKKIITASEMIKSIADQTNLLALNAAIEAARAGEAGKGFAVVADEIRKLAEESNRFTEEIGSIVQDLARKTETAVQTMAGVEEIVLSQTKSVDITNNKFVGIAKAIGNMKIAIDKVNDSSNEITNKKENIINIMENLSAISEENAAGTQEASASVEEQSAAMMEIVNSSEQLAEIAEDLMNQVKQFKV